MKSLKMIYALHGRGKWSRRAEGGNRGTPCPHCQNAGLTGKGAGWSLNRLVPREGAGWSLNRLVPQERELAGAEMAGPTREGAGWLPGWSHKRGSWLVAEPAGP